MGLSLINARPGAIDVFVDLEYASIAERLEYPLLVNALVELALARPLLDPVVRATRSVEESRIARKPIPAIRPLAVTEMPATTDLTPILIVLAMLLLLADVLISLPAGTIRRETS